MKKKKEERIDLIGRLGDIFTRFTDCKTEKEFESYFTGEKADALNKLGDEMSAQHAKDEEKEGKRGARNNGRKDRKKTRR